MGSSTFFSRAALIAALFVPAAAFAADLLETPVIVEPEPIPVEFGSNWYLRGYIGVSNQMVSNLDNALFATTTVNVTEKDFKPAALGGVGVGYQFNRFLRGDITAEYRHNSKFSGFDSYDDGLGSSGTNDYSAVKREYTFLANGYVDLGTWSGFTPYIGAGIGASNNTIDDFVDVNVPNNGGGTGGRDSKWNLAWALYAGFGYQIAPNLTVDLAYRYIHLGDAQTKDLIAFDGTNNIYNPMIFKDLSSHDVMLGFRYMIN